MKKLTMGVVLGVMAAGLCVSQALAAPYFLTNPPGTVKYEAKESLTNSTSGNSVVRSLGLTGDLTFGLLTDATLTTLSGSGAAFVSPVSDPHGIVGANNYITQGGGANKSTLDLAFNAAPGQWFTTGDFRVNTTLLYGNTNLWDPGVDYLAWQVSTDGGLTFTDIYKRFHAESGTSREDSGVLAIPGISGFSSIIIRGIADSSLGAQTVSTNSHWHLLDTAPFTTGTFAGGLELNLTTELAIPEPASLLLLATGGLLAIRRRRN